MAVWLFLILCDKLLLELVGTIYAIDARLITGYPVVIPRSPTFHASAPMQSDDCRSDVLAWAAGDSNLGIPVCLQSHASDLWVPAAMALLI